jgi:hypothetical protein
VQCSILERGQSLSCFILKFEKINNKHRKHLLIKSKSREREREVIFLSNEIIVLSVSIPESSMLFHGNMKASVVLFAVVITSFFFL